MIVAILAAIALLLAVLSLIPPFTNYPLLNCAVLLLAIGLALPFFAK